MSEDASRRSTKPAPVALYCVHGMGQQLRFDTLRQTARGLIRLHGEPRRIRTRLYRTGGRTRERLELTFEPQPDGTPLAELHLYEGYWAPLTEGRVTLRDVMGFLFSGAFNGLKQGGRDFRRWMFGGFQHHPVHRATFWQLLGILLVVTTLVGIDLVAGVVGAALIVASAGIGLELPAWLSGVQLRLFTTLLAIVLPAFLFIFGLLFALAFKRGRSFPGRPPSRLGALLWLLAVAGLTLVTLLPAVGEQRWWPYLVLTWLFALLLSLLFFWRPAGARPGANRWWQLAVTVVNRLVWLWIVLFGAAGLFLLGTFLWSLIGRAHFDGFAAGLPLMQLRVLLYVWIPLIAASWLVRRLLVQYVGDVAAYVSPHQLDRFNDIRREIKAAAVGTLRAIYQSGVTRPGVRYAKVGLFAHSLGSVIAYDALNAVLNEDELAHRQLDVAGRTEVFVSFGSPLDKTAFIFARRANDDHIRGRLAEVVQPLIQAYRPFRQLRWVNVFSHRDIISGALDFYDSRPPPARGGVHNLEDDDALITLLAHTEYWLNPTIFGELSKDLLGYRP